MAANQRVFYDPCDIPQDSLFLTQKESGLKAIMEGLDPVAKIENLNSKDVTKNQATAEACTE